MKKSLLLFPFLLFSCNGKDSSSSMNIDFDIPLFHSEYVIHNESDKKYQLLEYMTTDDINTAIERKQSFFVFVYNSGCGSCDNFNIVIRDYISKTNVVFPYTIWSYYNRSNNHAAFEKSGIAFYENGVLVDSIDDINSKVFDTNDFIKLLGDYTFDTEATILNPIKTNYPLDNNYSTMDFITSLDSITIDVSGIDEFILVNYDSYTASKYYDYLKDAETESIVYYSSSDTSEDIKSAISDSGDSELNTSSSYKVNKKEGVFSYTLLDF